MKFQSRLLRRGKDISEDGLIAEIQQNGVGILRSAFSPKNVVEARQTILAHIDLMRNTRPTPSSRHLAGFHRFPVLEPLHHLITGNQPVRDVMRTLLGPEIRTIGLSDITINRSQQWHKDLLRGSFSHFLDDKRPCEHHHGKLFKVIFYLQDSTSLHVIPGSHRQDVPLDSDESAIPADDTTVEQVEARTGDAVIIDICTTHRGSPETAFQSQHVIDNPRILVSTVFGGTTCDFTERMERGNAERLFVWQQSNH